MTDKLPECREAFERHFAANETYRIGKGYIDKFMQDRWAGWQASRSAFAAELVRRLEEAKRTLANENGFTLKEQRICFGSIDKAIAIIRQMAGEK